MEYSTRTSRFYRSFRAFLQCKAPHRGSSLKSSSKANKAARPVRRNDINATFVVASVAHTTVVPNQANSMHEAPPSTDAAKPAVVSLVAHYNS